MRFEIEAIIRARPGDVFAWWTDYGEAGHVERVGHGLGWSRREVLRRREDEVVLRETLPVLRVPLVEHRVRIERDRRRLHESSEDAFDAYWTFEEHPDGTRVRREVEVAPRLARFTTAKLTRVLMQRDLDHHARECERALALED